MGETARVEILPTELAAECVRAACVMNSASTVDASKVGAGKFIDAGFTAVAQRTMRGLRAVMTVRGQWRGDEQWGHGRVGRAAVVQRTGDEDIGKCWHRGQGVARQVI